MMWDPKTLPSSYRNSYLSWFFFLLRDCSPLTFSLNLPEDLDVIDSHYEKTPNKWCTWQLRVKPLASRSREEQQMNYSVRARVFWTFRTYVVRSHVTGVNKLCGDLNTGTVSTVTSGSSSCTVSLLNQIMDDRTMF